MTVAGQIDLSDVPPSARVRSVRYYGGKSPMGRGTGKWIAGLLPNPPGYTYCEPFCGMCGVLLQRAPARHEIINDMDGDIANFWRTLRDQPNELAHKIISTPHSRELFHEAFDMLSRDGGGALDRAWALFTTLNGSFTGRATDRSFAVSARCRLGIWSLPDLARLYKRIRNITVENCDGAEFIRRFGQNERVMLYIDPPYPSAHLASTYRARTRFDRLVPAIESITAPAAISGYPGEWDFLGWRRLEKTVTIRTSRKENKRRVTECLWTNPAMTEAMAGAAAREMAA